MTPARARALAAPALFVAATAGLDATGVKAEAVPIVGEAIKEMVVGKTVDLDTPLRTPITVVYKENGTLSATAGAALSLYLGSSSDRGRWWVDNGRLCQKFFKWLEGDVNCLRVRLDGRRIYWTRDDGRQGTATITASGPARTNPPYGLGVPDLRAAAIAKGGEPQVRADASAAAEAATKVEPPPMKPTPQLASMAPVRPVVREPARVRPAIPVPAPVALRIDDPAPRPLRAERLSSDPEWPAATTAAEQAIVLRGVMLEARLGQFIYGWCRAQLDTRGTEDAELLTAAPTLQRTSLSPELMVAWRRMAEEAEEAAAGCIAPAPVLMETSRLLFDRP